MLVFSSARGLLLYTERRKSGIRNLDLFLIFILHRSRYKLSEGFRWCPTRISLQLCIETMKLCNLQLISTLSMMAGPTDQGSDWLVQYLRSISMFCYTDPHYSTCPSSHLRTKLVMETVHVHLCGPGTRSDLISWLSYTADILSTVRYSLPAC